jgi:hypothetical protein
MDTHEVFRKVFTAIRLSLKVSFGTRWRGDETPRRGRVSGYRLTNGAVDESAGRRILKLTTDL